jgi:hypothetical protein
LAFDGFYLGANGYDGVRNCSRYPYCLYIVDQIIHMFYRDLGLDYMAPLCT